MDTPKNNYWVYIKHKKFDKRRLFPITNNFVKKNPYDEFGFIFSFIMDLFLWCGSITFLILLIITLIYE